MQASDQDNCLWWWSRKREQVFDDGCGHFALCPITITPISPSSASPVIGRIHNNWPPFYATLQLCTYVYGGRESGATYMSFKGGTGNNKEDIKSFTVLLSALPPQSFPPPNQEPCTWKKLGFPPCWQITSFTCLTRRVTHFTRPQPQRSGCDIEVYPQIDTNNYKYCANRNTLPDLKLFCRFYLLVIHD